MFKVDSKLKELKERISVESFDIEDKVEDEHFQLIKEHIQNSLSFVTPVVLDMYKGIMERNKDIKDIEDKSKRDSVSPEISRKYQEIIDTVNEDFYCIEYSYDELTQYELGEKLDASAKIDVIENYHLFLNNQSKKDDTTYLNFVTSTKNKAIDKILNKYNHKQIVSRESLCVFTVIYKNGEFFIPDFGIIITNEGELIMFEIFRTKNNATQSFLSTKKYKMHLNTFKKNIFKNVVPTILMISRRSQEGISCINEEAFVFDSTLKKRERHSQEMRTLHAEEYKNITDCKVLYKNSITIKKEKPIYHNQDFN